MHSGDDRLRVLVVDDDSDDATLLARRLRCCYHDADVQIATDVESAFGYIRAPIPPDITFVDLRMPVPGIVLIDWLRQDRQFDSMAVIAISGDPCYAHAVRPKQFGADATLLKPVNTQALLAVVSVAKVNRVSKAGLCEAD